VKHLRDERPTLPSVRVIYADLDGTILGPGGSLFAGPHGGTTLAAAEAIEALHLAGLDLVVMSGRTRRSAEVARSLGAKAFIAELGALVVEGFGAKERVIRTDGVGKRSTFDAILRNGAGGFLLERYPGRLLPVAPWAEVALQLHGLVDATEVTRALAEAGYGRLELRDNGRLRRMYTELEVDEVRAYHLLPKGVSKASAVRLHRERHGIEAAEAVAVGDSPADLEVAGEVGSFFLVANGVDAIGDAEPWPPNAYVTEAERGDGFAEAVRCVVGALRSRGGAADT